jgi:hypothetical protein
MLNITVHAQQRMAERGIKLPEVVAALKDGDKRPSKYRGHRDIWCSTAARTVVYAKTTNAITILTAY